VAPVERRPVLTSSDEKTLEARDERSYFARMYRTAMPVGAVGAALVLVGSGLRGLIGFAVGAAVALASVRGTQLMVRHVVRPGEPMMLERLVLLQILSRALLRWSPELRWRPA